VPKSYQDHSNERASACPSCTNGSSLSYDELKNVTLTYRSQEPSIGAVTEIKESFATLHAFSCADCSFEWYQPAR
jgi:hypothetical protein